MPITGVTGSTSTSALTQTSQTTPVQDSMGKDTFLKLLVAQMKYQDPMNPTDSSQFLAQSAQFTALEKMQDVADKTAQLFQAQVSFGASGFIGKAVTWTDSDGNTQSGSVHGVTFGKDGPMLDVGAGDPISIASVLSVTDGTATTTPQTTTNQ